LQFGLVINYLNTILLPLNWFSKSRLYTLRGIYRAKAGEGRGEASISGMLYFLLLLRFSFVPVFSNLALTMMLGSISKFLGFGSWRFQSKSSKTVKIKNLDQDVQTTSSWHI